MRKKGLHQHHIAPDFQMWSLCLIQTQLRPLLQLSFTFDSILWM